MRLFVALPLPEKIKQRLGIVVEKLRAECEGIPIKWVAPENIHLTLKFLGETEQLLVTKIGAEMKSVAADFPSFSCKLREIGGFPNLRKPRVLWTGIGPDSETNRLAELASTVDNRMHKLGFGMENRPFKSHLTIGRVRNRQNRLDGDQMPDNLREIVKDVLESSHEFRLTKIILFKSTLSSSGPVYEALESADLDRDEMSG